MADEPETDKITLIMPGLETKEGRKKIQVARDARQDVDFKCYVLLKEHVEELPDSIRYDAHELCRERKLADHDLLEAVAGR